MLLIIVFALVNVGSSHAYTQTEEKCHGGYYEFPYRFNPPLFKDPIYYKPRGEEQKLVVSEGQARDKRFLFKYGGIRMTDLTEQDNGGVLLFGRISSVKLVIDDCRDLQSSSYGDLFSWRLPSGAEYMEFSQMGSSGFALKPQVIWNRTDPSVGRGVVKRKYYELYNLKQKDSGYYKFMGARGGLIEWKRLEVKEYSRNLDEQMEGEKLKTYFPVAFSELPRVLFTHQGSDYEHEIDIEYMDRMELTDSYFSIRNLQYDDAGTYKFVDDEGFLAMRMEVEVTSALPPAWVFVVGLVIIVIFIVCCCCCVKKCCCKKSSNKRNRPETEAAAPPVFYHGTSQPTQSVIPLLSQEPRAVTANPPTSNSALRSVDLPTSRQVTAPGALGPTSTPVIPTSSNSEPRFDLKGTLFSSALPLSSGTSLEDVYTSDKLNFL